MFLFAVERLLEDPKLLEKLKNRRCSLVAHPASVDQQLKHSMDLIANINGIDLTCAFGPQHGMRGEKQDNMIESDDYRDPKSQRTVFSLYGQFRRPTDQMMQAFDVCLFDLQDVGCRIYTYLTTLFYMMDACEVHQKALWVLDRPNPAGRSIEGFSLNMDYATFVGAAPIPMRHGLTLGEIAKWYKDTRGYQLELEVIPMQGYQPLDKASDGWPSTLSWVNPSPNLPRSWGVRPYSGTVMVEGTQLSEGRGTTIPLEIMGAPQVDPDLWLKHMHHLAPSHNLASSHHLASQWLQGCVLRPMYFEPTFHKHKGKLCGGFQIHVDHPQYDPQKFRPFRLVAVALKAFYQLYPDFDLWRQPPYEYEEKHLPIDILSGDDRLRKWVEDDSASVSDLEEALTIDEKNWQQQIQPYLLY